MKTSFHVDGFNFYVEAPRVSLDRVRGSHHVYTGHGDTLSVPRSSGKVKRIYLQQILDRS